MTEIELSRRERKKEETRDRIFRCACKLFKDKGFEETTIDDITERADVAKGTFFNYFPRKEAVLGYLSEVRMAKSVEDAEAILAARKPAREKLIELFADVAAGYEEDRELAWFVLMESLKRAFAVSEDVHQRWHELAARVFEHGQQSGELARGVDPRRSEFVLHAVFMATLFMWLKCPEMMGMNLQDELKQRLTLVFDGLAA